MALRKSITLPSGVVVDYHRIEEVVYSRRARKLQIQLAAYISAEASNNGAAPVQTLGVITVEGDAAETVLQAIHDFAGPLVYAAAKETPEFSDADDA